MFQVTGVSILNNTRAESFYQPTDCPLALLPNLLWLPCIPWGLPNSVPSRLRPSGAYFSFHPGTGCLQTCMMSYLEFTRKLGALSVPKITAL